METLKDLNEGKSFLRLLNNLTSTMDSFRKLKVESEKAEWEYRNQLMDVLREEQPTPLTEARIRVRFVHYREQGQFQYAVRNKEDWGSSRLTSDITGSVGPRQNMEIEGWLWEFSTTVNGWAFSIYTEKYKFTIPQYLVEIVAFAGRSGNFYKEEGFAPLGKDILPLEVAGPWNE